MIELSVLLYLLKKENYEAQRDNIDIGDFTKEARPIIRTIDSYFTTTDNPTNLSVDSLANLYFSTNRTKIDYYQGVFEALRNNTASESSTETLIASLKQTRQLRELSVKAYELSEGRGTLEELTELASGLSTNKDNGNSNSEDLDDFVSMDLEHLVNTTRNTPGLRWRLQSLNTRLGSLRRGTFGFVFARPETGKTTFLASEVTYMASQAEGPVLWFNNEQMPEEVALRMYQSALGIDQVNLVRDIHENRKRFKEVTKENIRLKDGAAITSHQVENICEKLKPSLVVFDQIDKIKGFDNDREDLRLGSIYIWARELAKTYAPVIGVCQADGSGEGQRWLTMANVANAKTSKQAEADWILGIGKIADPGYDNLRFLHLSKNKLGGDEDTDPHLRHDRWETLIDTMTARYIDL